MHIKKTYKVILLVVVATFILIGVFFFYSQRTKVIKVDRDGIESVFIYHNIASIQNDNNSKLIEKIKKDIFHSFAPLTDEVYFEDLFGKANSVNEDYFGSTFYYDYDNALISVRSTCQINRPCTEWRITARPKNLNYKDFFPEYLINNLSGSNGLYVADDNDKFILVLYGDMIGEVIWNY